MSECSLSAPSLHHYSFLNIHRLSIPQCTCLISLYEYESSRLIISSPETNLHLSQGTDTEEKKERTSLCTTGTPPLAAGIDSRQ